MTVFFQRRQMIAALLIGAGLLGPMLPGEVAAQANRMAGIARSASITAQGRIISVDQATRRMVIETSDGKRTTVVAGPEVVNLPQVKAGDMVAVTFEESVSYVLTPPTVRTPRDSRTEAAVRAAPGQTPGAVVGERSVITATVFSTDPATKTLQLFDPSGGAVRSFRVTSPEGIANFGLIKPGYTITATTTEVAAVALVPLAR